MTEAPQDASAGTEGVADSSAATEQHHAQLAAVAGWLQEIGWETQLVEASAERPTPTLLVAPAVELGGAQVVSLNIVPSLGSDLKALMLMQLYAPLPAQVPAGEPSYELLTLLDGLNRRAPVGAVTASPQDGVVLRHVNATPVGVPLDEPATVELVQLFVYTTGLFGPAVHALVRGATVEEALAAGPG